ncbi:g11287 [Coccomyxa elongata]
MDGMNTPNSQREDGGEQDQEGMDSLGQVGRKRGRSTGGASTASRRHIQTEQRRRDKINEGYQELQKLLGVENIEKATLLTQAADYTRQLQAAMRQLLELQGPAKLPEDMQWAIRMLLPRPAGSPAPVAPAAAAAAVAMASSAGAGGAEGAGHAAALALLAEHAQQAQAHAATQAPQVGAAAFQPTSAAPPQPQPFPGAPGPAATGTAEADPNAVLQAVLASMQQQQQQQAVNQQASQQLQGWQGAGNILQVLQIQQLLQGGLAQPQQQQQQPPQPNQAQLNNLNLLLPSLANVMQAPQPQAPIQAQPGGGQGNNEGDSGATASSGSPRQAVSQQA